MRRGNLAALTMGLAIFVLPLLAHSAGDEKNQAAKPPEKIQAAKISKADCRYLIRHRPAGDVAYKPGVDVHGRKVVPADLPRGNDALKLDKVNIDLIVPLRRLFPGIRPRALGRSKVNLGRITVDVLSGKTLYNGKPLIADSEARLVAFCGKSIGAKAK